MTAATDDSPAMKGDLLYLDLNNLGTKKQIFIAVHLPHDGMKECAICDTIKGNESHVGNI